MPGHRRGDSRDRSNELQRDLRALYEMYRSGDVSEHVLQLAEQLETAYWDVRFAENASVQPGHKRTNGTLN